MVDYKPLLDIPEGLYNYGPREIQDRGFSFTYGITIAAVLAVGAYSGSNFNKEYADGKLDFTKHATCNAGPQNDALMASLGEEAEFDGNAFMKDTKYWLIATFFAAFALGLFFLYLFRICARQLVWAIIYAQVISMAVSGVYVLSHNAISGALLLCLALIMTWCFWVWRAEIELSARLLTVASCSLNQNPHIITAVLFIKCMLTFVLAPIIASLMLAYMNGAPAPDPNVLAGAGGKCTIASGAEVPCCMWQPEGWVRPFMVLAALTATWTTFLAFEIRTFTIGGTVAQWYFAPAGTTEFTGTTLGAMRNAVGPSFGSLCYGSLVLTAIKIMRDLNEHARRSAARQGGIAALVACICTACLDCIYALIEYISKFATLQCAITGHSFCEAARSVSSLLADNAFSAYGVWWFPPMILRAAAGLLSTIFGVVVGLSSWGYFAHEGTSGGNKPLSEAIVLGVMAFVVALVVLGFFITVLLNVVDAVFLCYVMDKDRQMVSREEVHEVYYAVQLKQAGPAVEQPGGEIAYGNPGGAAARV